MVAPLSSVEWNTIYGNCWKQKRAAEADERHVMQWKCAKPSRNLIFIYHFFFPPLKLLLCCFWLWGNGGGGGEGSIKWLRETAAGYSCRPGAPTLDKNRSAPRWQHILHAGTPLQSPDASANLRKGENFIPPTHEYPWGQSFRRTGGGENVTADEWTVLLRRLSPPLVPLLLSTVFPSLSEIHLFSCEL